MAQEIKIQPEHLALIKNCYIQYEDGIEYGGFAQDPKRPYGNSSVLPDIRDIFEEEGFDAYSDEQLHQFHRELRDVLTISIQEQSWDIVGRTYESKYGFEWERVDTLDCSEISDWDEIEEAVKDGYKQHPFQFRLTVEQFEGIFKLDNGQATEVIDRLEAKGFLERQIHRRCRKCNSGIDFVLPPEDDGISDIDCHHCQQKRPAIRHTVYVQNESQQEDG